MVHTSRRDTLKLLTRPLFSSPPSWQMLASSRLTSWKAFLTNANWTLLGSLGEGLPGGCVQHLAEPGHRLAAESRPPPAAPGSMTCKQSSPNHIKSQRTMAIAFRTLLSALKILMEYIYMPLSLHLLNLPSLCLALLCCGCVAISAATLCGCKDPPSPPSPLYLSRCAALARFRGK